MAVQATRYRADTAGIGRNRWTNILSDRFSFLADFTLKMADILFGKYILHLDWDKGSFNIGTGRGWSHVQLSKEVY